MMGIQVLALVVAFLGYSVYLLGCAALNKARGQNNEQKK